MERAFYPFSLHHGLLMDMRDGPFPTVLSAWAERKLPLESDATHFGFVFDGTPTLVAPAGEFTLQPGMYFSLNGPGRIGGSGRGIVISRIGYHGFFSIGGPVEERGRLQYIDGCTDSLLLPPVMLGDACLNLLHIPPGTRQSRHTHPSLRAGIVISGTGRCVTPEGDSPLKPGVVFVIPPDGLHSFYTDEQALRVIAFHPDSDFGPTHEDHPMLNRTLVAATTDGQE